MILKYIALLPFPVPAVLGAELKMDIASFPSGIVVG